MENIDLIQMWKQYDEKLERSLSLNHKIITEIQQQKAKNALKPAKRIKWVAIIFGILWVVFLAYLVYHSLTFSKLFFVISLSVSIIITAIAIAVYIYQLVLINEIDNSESVIQMQQKLASLQTAMLKVVGILLLQLPFYSTWYINFEWIKNSPQSFWFFHVPIVLLFAFASIWLYRNITIKNIDKKWFKFLFRNAEWTAVIKSGQFLKEIEHFEKG